MRPALTEPHAKAHDRVAVNVSDTLDPANAAPLTEHGGDGGFEFGFQLVRHNQELT